MRKEYSDMSFDELDKERFAWISVTQMPHGPGMPSKAAREAAESQVGIIEAWMARRNANL